MNSRYPAFESAVKGQIGQETTDGNFHVIESLKVSQSFFRPQAITRYSLVVSDKAVPCVKLPAHSKNAWTKLKVKVCASFFLVSLPMLS
jgi:hypothetical protein